MAHVSGGGTANALVGYKYSVYNIYCATKKKHTISKS